MNGGAGFPRDTGHDAFQGFEYLLLQVLAEPSHVLERVQEAPGGDGVDGGEHRHGIRHPLDALRRPHFLVVDGHGQEKGTAPGGLGDVEGGLALLLSDHLENIVPVSESNHAQVVGVPAQVAVPPVVDLIQDLSALGRTAAVEGHERSHAIVGGDGLAEVLQDEGVAFRRIVHHDEFQEHLLEHAGFDAFRDAPAGDIRVSIKGREPFQKPVTIPGVHRLHELFLRRDQFGVPGAVIAVQGLLVDPQKVGGQGQGDFPVSDDFAVEIEPLLIHGGFGGFEESYALHVGQLPHGVHPVVEIGVQARLQHQFVPCGARIAERSVEGTVPVQGGKRRG